VLANARELPVELAAQVAWDAAVARASPPSAGAYRAEAVGAAPSAANRNAWAARSVAQAPQPTG